MMKSYAPKTMAELPASLAALTPESKIVGGGTDFVIRPALRPRFSPMPSATSVTFPS